MSSPRHILSAEFWSHGDRPWYPALGVSTLLHIGAIIALGLVWTRVEHRDRNELVESRWSAESLVEQPLEVSATALPDRQESLDPGGRPSATAALGSQPAAPAVRPPSLSELIVTDADAEGLFTAHLTDSVGPLAGAGSPSEGEGNGERDGTGDGDGQAFFGLKADGRRFVYVVDSSRSMNHPHESEWKTRFARVKYEILKSVGGMSPDQQFFIIFFSDKTHPMPASGLQSATGQSKQRYLRWMAGREANGDTDPIDAMSLAMRLQPDVIYFLTDGSFKYRAIEELKELRQQRTAIHTFCFGDRAGEDLLRFVAQNNGGEYHFVP